MAATATTAPTRASSTYERPTASSWSRPPAPGGTRRRARPPAALPPPPTAAPRRRPCPAFPGAFSPLAPPAGVPALFGLGDSLLVLVLGLVGLVVLDQDAVAEEHLTAVLPVALDHHRLAGPEHVGRAALVLDPDRHAVEHHRKAQEAAVLDGFAGDRSLQAEALGAEAVALGHGLVGGAKVQGGVGQALVGEEAQAQYGHREHGQGQPAPVAAAGAAPDRGLVALVLRVERAGGQLHRRSEAGTCRDSLRTRRTTCQA